MARILYAALLALASAMAWASATDDALLPMQELHDLTLEELLGIDVVVTSVAKKPQKLSEVTAAAFVITNEDIRRAGVLTIPDALRMVPGVQVANINANMWAVSARGFNGRLANKLLVMIDGRSVYHPLFSGVFWDEQDVLLEDIARIEVIRGPGATLWGANAVNGVINIITKSAADTQGGLLAGGAGSEQRGFASARYGASLGKDTHYRIYTKYFERDEFVDLSGDDAADDWDMVRGGFRMDSQASSNDSLTLQGDLYDGDSGQTVGVPTLTAPYAQILRTDVAIAGANLLGRWRHVASKSAEWSLQLYYDQAERKDPGIFRQNRDTFDADFQHRFAWGERQRIGWGLGYRMYRIDTNGTLVVSLDPEDRTDHLYSGFLQDDITLIEDRLRLTLGSKFEHNDFTGFEVQPNVRLLWTPHERHTLWAAISRAVRTPSQAEHDTRFNQAVFPTDPTDPNSPLAVVSFIGRDSFDAEDLLAYELGYRVQPVDRVFLDFAAFYNRYDGLLTQEPFFSLDTEGLPVDQVFGVLPANNMEAESYGLEVAADWQASDGWRLQAAYSYLRIQAHLDADSTDTTSETIEGHSPEHQFSLRSSMDLSSHLELDLWLRYVDELASLGVNRYLTLDARLGWNPRKDLELSLVGQNLFDSQHPEFIPEFVDIHPAQVERGVYAKALWRF